ncbi:MAG TPA: hypothetical protein VKB75_12400, partial [Jatrophihabitans sp.]|nr:hypothetical protein [Jatrophihabitans sp.]
MRDGLSVGAELLGTGRVRRSWVGNGRAWIELRGLDGPGGDDLASGVLAAVRRAPGVRGAVLNRAVSRLVVELDSDAAPVSELVAGIEHLERQFAARETEGVAGPAGSPADRRQGVNSLVDLPGDGVVMAGRALALGADGLGLAFALAGRVLRWPRPTRAVAAPVALIDAQPRARRALERRLGVDATDVVVALANAAAQALAQSPGSLAVDLLVRGLSLAEALAGRRAWRRHEPELFRQALCAQAFGGSRQHRVVAGPGERYSDAAAAAGLLGAATLGLVTGRAEPAADALLVAVPRALRTARESFAATLA